MRYTEARLTEVAALLLEGIDEDAVDFRPTYDRDESEPLVLPANFPNLLANGAQGIAVGMATSIPPHNAAELCAALSHLIKHPNAGVDKLVELVPGPDFPTGGVLVEPRSSIVEAYATGRGGFRVRARWQVERLKGGGWQIVVTEVPYQVPKARLVERIAELLLDRKLTLLADVRDESTDDVRLVLEPKSRTVDPAVLMESLFRQTDLELRIGLNMTVLDADNVPRVMSLREVLQAFLDHRHEVLVRRTRHRLDRIGRRLEVLAGYLIAFLNLDEVIRIIREADEPKPALMARLGLSDPQAEAVLDMRLRALRRLEETAIRREHERLGAERVDLEGLLADEARRWKAVAAQIAELRKQFGPDTPLGRRRTELGAPPPPVAVPLEAVVEREPVTVVCSAKGWVRTFKGQVTEPGEVKYKEGDGPRYLLSAETTDRLVLLASNGRFYTLPVDRLPGGRGHGEPLRLMVDLEQGQDVVALMVHRPGRELLIAGSDGRGFIVAEDDVLGQTRAGKQVLNLAGGAVARACVPVAGDAVAVIGDNRRLLIFALDEVPRMARGRGVILQRYRDGGMSDLTTFGLAGGLSWRSGERTRTESDLRPWLGRRGQAGRLPPVGFPRSNRFA
jgi:topoisomerase-4 subunit A